jgi:hypothetical protein
MSDSCRLQQKLRVAIKLPGGKGASANLFAAAQWKTTKHTVRWNWHITPDL